MSYKVTGIVIKGTPLGEVDRLVTLLTPEQGIIKAVAPGARRHRSVLRGRTELLVVNDFVLSKGRSFARIQQADTQASYGALSRDFAKLAAGQYLAEVASYLGVNEAPQVELYELLCEHLRRLEVLILTPDGRIAQIMAHLCQALFHLMAIAGIAPQVQNCTLSQKPCIIDETDPRWRIGFNFELGGLMTLGQGPVRPDYRLTAQEVILLQGLPNRDLDGAFSINSTQVFSSETAWLRLEQLLRAYLTHQICKPLKTAALIDTLAPLAF